MCIICTVFDAYSAVLFLPSTDDETCTLAASYSHGDGVDTSATVAPGQGLVGWIVRNRQLLCVPNFDHYQSRLGYYRDREEESIKAFMGCPLSCGGVLCLDSRRQYAFSEKDNRILQLFAELVAKLRVRYSQQSFLADIPRYFSQLSLLQDLPGRHQRWNEHLREYLQTVVQTSGFDYGAFASIENPGETYVVDAETTPLMLLKSASPTLSINHGIVGWVFRNDQQVVVEGSGSDTAGPGLFGREDEEMFRTLMCMPISVDKVTQAVLCLASRKARRIDESLRTFVKLAVDQMAFYLENLYLRTRLRNLMPKVDLKGNGRATRQRT